MHAAATIIQQRFWYAKARWITRARLERIITNRHGLHYTTLSASVPMQPIDQFTRLLVFGPLSTIFARWLRRIIFIGKRDTDKMDDDIQQLATSNPGGAINRVLSAYLFALYSHQDTDVMDMSLNGAREVYVESKNLCYSIEMCMQRDPSGPCTQTQLARNVVLTLNIFLDLHREWTRKNNHIILQRLVECSIMRMHSLIGTRYPVFTDQRFGSYAIRSIAATGNVVSIHRLLFNSPAFRVMRRMANNEFWGTHGLHTTRFVHELMIDPGFKLPLEQTIPALSRKYAAHRRFWSANELLMDVGVVIMWECRTAGEVTALAEAVDLDASPELLDDLPATAERIRRIVCRLIPATALASLMELQCMGTGGRAREPLENLLHYALVLRNAWANRRINDLREYSGQEANGFEALAAYQCQLDASKPSNPTNRNWIQDAVLRCDSKTITDHLARGDPFALLKLHDHAIIDTVLKDLGRRIELASLPDMLRFDLERLQSIRQTLHRSPRKEFNHLFHELVTSGEDVSRTLSAEVVEAAAKLRAVVFVCRRRHGNMVAQVASEIARAIANVASLQSLELKGNDTATFTAQTSC